MSVSKSFFEKHKENRTVLKVFLTNKTMLEGMIKEADDEAIVLNECLIRRAQITSSTPK